MHQLPSTGFVRLSQIIGNPKKGIPPLIPVSRSTFWIRVKEGVYPKGVLLGPRTRAWRVEEIRSLIANPSPGGGRLTGPRKWNPVPEIIRELAAVGKPRSLREELESIHSRMAAPGRLCDECGLSPVDGPNGKLAFVTMDDLHLLYSLCGRCGATDTPNIHQDAKRIRDCVISESAAKILGMVSREIDYDRIPAPILALVVSTSEGSTKVTLFPRDAGEITTES